jgi:signal peptidase II
MKRQKEVSNPLFALIGILLIMGLTGLDQWTKFLAKLHLKGSSSVTLIPGVLQLHYLENRGMAFGMLQGKILVFLLLCLVFFGVAFYVFVRTPKTTYYLPFLAVIFVLLSGAAGNFIDRAFRGYVIDFIYFSLIDFPIFNLADIYVVCSCIFLIVLVCLKYKDDDFNFLNPRYKG